MRLGVCLTGGGAKGAFEAGALKRLYESGIEPEVVTGTSIGAFNGYFLMKGCLRELYDFWLEMGVVSYQGKADLVIDNSAMIQVLRELQGSSPSLGKLFVNYVAIENKKLKEQLVNLRELGDEEALAAVKYSSLLPYRAEESQDSSAAQIKFDSTKVFENFRIDVEMGIYDGFKLDGGILNNSLLLPFIQERVDKLLIIALKNNYAVPQYISDSYKAEDIVVLEPDIVIAPEDTLRFEKDYCSNMFSRGYDLAGNIINKLK